MKKACLYNDPLPFIVGAFGVRVAHKIAATCFDVMLPALENTTEQASLLCQLQPILTRRTFSTGHQDSIILDNFVILIIC